MESETTEERMEAAVAPSLSRRNFLLGGVVAGLSVAAAGAVVGCAPSGAADVELAETGEEGAAPQLGPNEYQAHAMGIDEITVTMEIVDGQVKDIEIEHCESPEIGGGFIDMMASQIKSSNSPEIDIITGATATSWAVREAARNCFAQAAGEAEALPEDDCISPIEPAEAPASWDQEADVAIVGASVAGLVAAKLAQGGKSVIVLEKEAKVGGGGRVTTCISNYGGNKLWGDGPAYFAEEYHDQDVIDFFQERATWSIDPELLKNTTISLRETYDWWLDNGASLAMIGGWWSMWLPDFSSHDPEAVHASATTAQLANWLQELAEQNGAQFLMNTPAKRLVKDGDAVVGIEAQDPTGATLYVKGSEAVILAADNMQRNKKMLEAYGGLAAKVKSGLAKGNGQVIRMGQGVGADMSGLGSFAASTSCPVPEGARKMLPIRRNYDNINYLFANPFCRFDSRGDRVAYVSAEMCEKFGENRDVIDCNHRQCDQDLMHGDTFVVMDAHWLENLEKNGVTGFRAMPHKTLPTCDQCWEDVTLCVPEYHGSRDLAENLEEMVMHGAVKKADTLEELAEAMGVDAEVLAGAVEAWNADCAAGQGDAVHGYTAQNRLPLRMAPSTAPW